MYIKQHLFELLLLYKIKNTEGVRYNQRYPLSIFKMNDRKRKPIRVVKQEWVFILLTYQLNNFADILIYNSIILIMQRLLSF